MHHNCANSNFNINEVAIIISYYLQQEDEDEEEKNLYFGSYHNDGWHFPYKEYNDGLRNRKTAVKMIS